MSIIDKLLDTLLPHDCVGCGVEGKLLCDNCASALKLPIAYDRTLKVSSVASYEGPAKDLIWKLKSDGVQIAATVMAQHMATLIPPGHDYLIVPVPTATSRARQRGYDQANLLARALSRQTRQSYLNCLGRHGKAHQVGASRQERLHQLTGAFWVKKTKSIQNKHIIIVDDVSTTGASLEAAATVLMAAGAKTVEAITFAQA